MQHLLKPNSVYRDPEIADRINAEIAASA